MEIDEHIRYWLNSADHDLETAESLFSAGKFDWCLFLGHLVLEKALKAFYVKNRSDYPPYIHNLLRLAEKADIKFDNDKKEQFVTITAFNINSRYDDYQMSFKNLCTPEFTSEWIDKIKELRKWIKQLINQ